MKRHPRSIQHSRASEGSRPQTYCRPSSTQEESLSKTLSNKHCHHTFLKLQGVHAQCPGEAMKMSLTPSPPLKTIEIDPSMCSYPNSPQSLASECPSMLL
mmetsp:Transcript_9900/g.26908  ORF Transcript_9900/g.26908 Transcript_9900/m.26908 type:complete len:100 (-) Transcript_9900:375-674(-)